MEEHQTNFHDDQIVDEAAICKRWNDPMVEYR
jgi:hypothetical protein